MPRMVAPPPSGEFAIHLTKPYSGTPNFTIEIIGEPNRSAVVRRTNVNADGSKNGRTGDVPKDDVQELMSLISAVRGFPSHPSRDIYGVDSKLDLTTFDIQWGNQDEDPSADQISEIDEEQKDEFKRVVDSIEALARTFATKDAAN